MPCGGSADATLLLKTLPGAGLTTGPDDNYVLAMADAGEADLAQAKRRSIPGT